MKFTENQQRAIDIRDKNILVSAAAGSGKTAVLVNRIIDRVLDENDPVDIDRILVMTFTNAAAAQMKERILDAIEEKRKVNPSNKNLQKQAALIHSANISTIDSFCLNVVRNHFSDININPDFRIADQGELKLIKQDVLESVMESEYERGEDSFLDMTECFSYGRTDRQIENIIIQLHDFAQSYPDPEKWLLGCTSEYDSVNEENLNEAKWICDYLGDIKFTLIEMKKLLEKSIEVCNEELGPYVYIEALENDISYIEKIVSLSNYSDLYNFFENVGEPSFSKLKSLKMLKEGEASLEEIETQSRKKTYVTDVRDKYKTYIKSIYSDISNNSPEGIVDDMVSMAPYVGSLVKTTILFLKEFANKKREKNIVDFNDLEHMCLDILKTSESASLEYRDHFKEIYVDEYQDSNLVQEEIVKLLCVESETKGNLFMVGDVKQSIYGFRLARPEIFVEKYNRFPEYDESLSADVKIDLHDNFRSRTTVIDSVNDVFKHIMTENTGGIIYDEKASLHAKAEYPDGEGFSSELIYAYHIDEVNDRVLEAHTVAERIKELKRTLLVTKDNNLVPLKYSDIVILLRSAKDWDTVFQSVLEGEGIPVHVDSSTGYFSRPEVYTLLEYLKVIDNPRQDIPLMSVLRSPIGNMYDEEIAIIRGAFPQGDLYSSVLSYLNTEGNEADIKGTIIKKKLGSFITELEYYRRKTSYTTVDMIITEIIDGYYGDCVLVSNNGKKKYANLQMLLEKAKEYGKTSYKGIFHFNRYIETLHKYEVDFGQANVLDENEDAVRIMTIHKSKGLEFPVCFISGMNKKMNTMDEKDTVLADADRGIGVDIIDIEHRTRKKSLFKKALAKKKHLDSLSEELRVFYVAMTRAKEKLIMSSVIKKEGELQNNNVILLKASSYLDLYKYVSSNYGINSIEEKEYGASEIMSTKIESAVTSEFNKETLINEISEGSAELSEDLKACIEFRYPYEDDKSGIKVSVSELKRRSMALSDAKEDNDNEIILYKEPEKIVPLFMKKEAEESFSPALRGTAVHRVFEIWDYNRSTTMESVSTFLDEMMECKRLEADLYPLVNRKLVYNFVNSDIAGRMSKALMEGQLFREQPFVIEDAETKMLIQGIIDAYFIENDEIVVVDYKTDRVESAKELVEKYKIQLDYYGTALAMLSGKKIKEKVIYSTCLNKSITM